MIFLKWIIKERYYPRLFDFGNKKVITGNQNV